MIEKKVPIEEVERLHDELVAEVTGRAQHYEDRRRNNEFPSLETMFFERGFIMGLKAAIVAQRAFIEAQDIPTE